MMGCAIIDLNIQQQGGVCITVAKCLAKKLANNLYNKK